MEQKHNFEPPKEDPKTGNAAASKLTGDTPPVSKNEDLNALKPENMPNREPATDEESAEGKLTGSAAATNSSEPVGGAQKGKADGETWENDKHTKATSQPRTSTHTKETSGSTAQDPKTGDDAAGKPDDYSTWHV